MLDILPVPGNWTSDRSATTEKPGLDHRNYRASQFLSRDFVIPFREISGFFSLNIARFFYLFGLAGLDLHLQLSGVQRPCRAQRGIARAFTLAGTVASSRGVFTFALDACLQEGRGWVGRWEGGPANNVRQKLAAGQFFSDQLRRLPLWGWVGLTLQG